MTVSSEPKSEIASIIIPTLNEEANIERVIKSLYDQDYRPMEIVIVDGGSTDGTLNKAHDLQRKYSNESFVIKILRGVDFGKTLTPANLKNIGIEKSCGDYLIFLDADMFPLEKFFISKVVKALRNYPWVGVKIKTVIDTRIEKAIVAEGSAFYRDSPEYGKRKYCAIKRELVKKRAFDPSLGIYEDVDFFEDYLERKLRLKPFFIDALLGMHDVHTFKQFCRRERWYGRAILPYVLKRLKDSPKQYCIKVMIERIAPILLPFLALIFACLALTETSFYYMLVPILGLFLYRRIRFFKKIPAEYRTPDILLLLTVLGCIIRPVTYGFGLIEGLFGYLRGSIKLTRD